MRLKAHGLRIKEIMPPIERHREIIARDNRNLCTGVNCSLVITVN